MYSLLLVKVAVQPSLQSWPIERSDPDASVGEICVIFAFALSPGMCSWPVWVARMVALLRRSTVILFDVGVTLVTGTSVWM